MEKRRHERLVINANGSFILYTKDNKIIEFFGKVEDISESGIKVCVDNDKFTSIANDLSEGDTITFQCMDSLNIFKKDTLEIFQGESSVVRKEIESDSIVIGCQFNKKSASVEKYLEDKRLSIYIKTL